MNISLPAQVPIHQFVFTISHDGRPMAELVLKGDHRSTVWEFILATWDPFHDTAGACFINGPR